MLNQLFMVAVAYPVLYAQCLSQSEFSNKNEQGRLGKKYGAIDIVLEKC